MSKTFKVSPQDKKSIGCTEIFEKTVDGVTYRAELENWYRWGYAIISGVEDETELAQEHGTLEVSGYTIEDHSFDDGVAAYWYYGNNVTDEMKQELEAAWDEDWYDGVEELGWTLIDTETYFHGPLEVEFISEEVEEDSTGETVAPKASWPF
jgi:hypothetical protein